MLEQDYEPEQSGIFEETEQPKCKPWVRAAALVLVFCLLYQNVIFGLGPDLESTLNLKLQKPAKTAQNLLLSSLGSISKVLFISYAYADNNLPTKSNSSFTASTSSATERNYTDVNTASISQGEGAGLSTGQNPAPSWPYAPVTGSVYQYRAAAGTSPNVTYGSSSWSKTDVSYNPGSTYRSANAGQWTVMQAPSESKYYIDVRPSLPKAQATAGVTLVRTNATKERPVVSAASTKLFIPEAASAQLGEQKAMYTVKISRGGLAAKELNAAQANLNLAKNINVEITRRAATPYYKNTNTNSISFARSSEAVKFYKPPAFSAMNIFNQSHNNINKPLKAPEKVFASLPKTIFAHNTITGYRGPIQDNLAPPAVQDKKESSQRSTNSLETRQPLMPPIAPVNVAQPPADSGPAPSPSTPDTGASSTTTSTSAASGNNTGSIQQPYGLPPATVSLPGFYSFGSYETVLSTLAQLHGEELASVRGDGGVIVPGSGILPSPEAGRDKEGNGFFTPFHLISAQQVLLLLGKTPENSTQKCSDFANGALKAGKTLPEKAVLFVFSASSRQNNIGNIYIQNSNTNNSQACNPASGEPLRRALRPNSPVWSDSGNNAPVFGFLTLKSDTGVLPQIALSKLGVFTQAYNIGIKG